MVKMRDAVRFGVECPECGKESEQTVGWLADHDRLPCPACGFSIDLEATGDRVKAKKLDDACAQLDRPAAKLS